MSEARLRRFVEPFASHWLDLDGVRYHYLDEGPRNAPALLALHGNPTWCFFFRALVAGLRERYRVVVPDHVGCGLSDKPARYPYRLEQHVRNARALVERLGLERLTLVLHDWGGAIGMGLAVAEPRRIARLVLLNTAAFALPRCPLRIRICRAPLLGPVLVRGLNGFSRAALRFASAHPSALSAHTRAGYLAPYDSWGARVAVLRFVQDIPLEAEHPTRPVLDRIEAGLPAFADRPTLVVWGARDFCFTVEGFLDRWRELFPQARVHVLEQAGHYVLEDAPAEALAFVEDFLAETAAP